MTKLPNSGSGSVTAVPYYASPLKKHMTEDVLDEFGTTDPKTLVLLWQVRHGMEADPTLVSRDTLSEYLWVMGFLELFSIQDAKNDMLIVSLRRTKKQPEDQNGD